jgi:AraC-like DNA-binding protein
MARAVKPMARLTFDDWAPDLDITRDGKHLYAFKPDFPLAVFSYRFPYYYWLVPNYHDYLEITYNYGAAGILNVSDREYEMATGSVAVIGPNEMHRIHNVGKTHLEMLSVFFLPSLISAPGPDDYALELARPFFDGKRHVLAAADLDGDAILDCLREMLRLENARPRFYRLHLRQLLFQLLLLILHQYDDAGLLGRGAEGSRFKSAASLGRLNKVFGLVESRYREQIPLERAARMCSLSPTSFCRYFQKVTGTSFVDYLNNYRISRAKELLLAGGLTATQVAYEVGFSNLGYFFRVFKKYAHLTPREFLRERRA